MNQFLFDKYKTGRIAGTIGNNKTSKKLWAFKTRGYPLKGPESTPVFDKNMNLYFGCHDGCIYSLSKCGELRWMFSTDNKVYSSPLITDDENIIIGGGDGYLYNFSENGELIWVYDISKNYRQKSLKLLLSKILNIHKTYDFNKTKICFEKKQIWKVKCWSSPAIGENHIVYITGYGIGLHAVDINSGTAKWTYDLGNPRFHLAGIAIDNDNNIIACSQQRNIHCINEYGKLLWKTRIIPHYDMWGNPTIDPDTGNIFLSASYREKNAIVYSIDRKGVILWTTQIDGAIRGSMTISRENYIICCSLNGKIYFIEKESGKIILVKKFSDARRALWTSASIDLDGRILFTTKDSNVEGSLVCLDKYGELIWRDENIGKSLSVPIVDLMGRVYVGSWNGEFICYET